MVEQTGPVSGATVRDDGGVNLIVDIGAMLKLAEQTRGSRAARACPPNVTLTREKSPSLAGGFSRR